MSSGAPTDPRPLSPHLQVWRFHLTMLASITHRATGVALYFGTVLIAAWLFSLSLPLAGTEPPAFFMFLQGLMTSVFGQIVLTLWAAAVLFHFANGIRHLLWDGPRIGFDPKTASAWSAFNYVFAALGAIGIWFAATQI